MKRAYCEHCLTQIEAHVVERANGAWLVKTCPTHGTSEHLIEPDIEFYRRALVQDSNTERRGIWAQYFTATGLDVTRRCNVTCPHCYVEPDNRVKDQPIETIVATARKARKADNLILMGAEPTVRSDLAELITALKRETGKLIGLYTNAVRFATPGYAEELKAAGLGFVCVSLHTPQYLGDPKLFERKLIGIKHLIASGVEIHHVSFSLQSLDDLNGVLASCLELAPHVGHLRIRSPQKIGHCDDEPIALSELYGEVCRRVDHLGVEVLLSDNTPYHVTLLVGGKAIVRLIRWPTLASADLHALDCPPYALFDEDAGEVNLVLSFLLQEARRKQVSISQPTEITFAK